MSFLGFMAWRKKRWSSRLKPGVNRGVHLFAAPLLWTMVGSVLMTRGWEWIGAGGNIWYIAAALAAGTLKSLWILDKTARRAIDRIVKLRDGTCLGAIYSWKTWVLAVIMIASGILLRTVSDPGPVLGAVYLAVGWALLFSSRLGWLAWSRWIRN
ncbi:MAG: hypothetical protein RBR09_08245 [Desulfobulbaceae bacterium]|jgi:hypothetical protein|nr:hypothetical protein [Desulfobulbaceae bacterium]MDY0351229.1 hypothetical protein [Desulfobulbaceae bacterium]